MSELPTPQIDELTAPYWEGLKAGELRFQRCSNCQNAWLPMREECPRCLGPDWELEVSAGRGKVISWVIYHRAFNAYFSDRLPYNVAIVELAEGPRLLTNLLHEEGQELAIEQPVELAIEEEAGWALARFRLLDRSDA